MATLTIQTNRKTKKLQLLGEFPIVMGIDDVTISEITSESSVSSLDHSTLENFVLAGDEDDTTQVLATSNA